MNIRRLPESVRGNRGPRLQGLAVLLLCGVLTTGTVLYSGCGVLAEAWSAKYFQQCAEKARAGK